VNCVYSNHPTTRSRWLFPDFVIEILESIKRNDNQRERISLQYDLLVYPSMSPFHKTHQARQARHCALLPLPRRAGTKTKEQQLGSTKRFRQNNPDFHDCDLTKVSLVQSQSKYGHPSANREVKTIWRKRSSLTEEAGASSPQHHN